MGEVYLAEDNQLKRKVALKFLPVHLATNADMRARFTREAQASAKLDHPNIVPVYEVGEYQGRPFFAMAHIKGKPLREVIKEGKLSVKETVNLAMQICEGLNEAHTAGVIHRLGGTLKLVWGWYSRDSYMFSRSMGFGPRPRFAQS